MSGKPRGQAELIRQATQLAELWQYRGNRATEQGNHSLAERHYERSQRWRDEMNRLLGNRDGSEAEASPRTLPDALRRAIDAL
jgi:formate dehydrogenase maturation protein FdhE